MQFNRDKRTAKSVAHLAGIDVMTIAYKEVGEEGVPIDERIGAFIR